ncbi:uncharacterized protein DKFZp434B061-like isoform X1 [Octodon degus]|uniref:Uncharacterized protein DKFZp434B061-like isoform X1 n=1 Tax=Octodon degus TaxID=10160 RepID=A0A6P6DRS0_OCTDE|nr:uncharacterized protein DKFZp434B061-like isoform X1 [Octodon degus]
MRLAAETRPRPGSPSPARTRSPGRRDPRGASRTLTWRTRLVATEAEVRLVAAAPGTTEKPRTSSPRAWFPGSWAPWWWPWPGRFPASSPTRRRNCASKRTPSRAKSTWKTARAPAGSRRCSRRSWSGRARRGPPGTQLPPASVSPAATPARCGRGSPEGALPVQTGTAKPTPAAPRPPPGPPVLQAVRAPPARPRSTLGDPSGCSRVLPFCTSSPVRIIFQRSI